MPGRVIRKINFRDKEILKYGVSLDGVPVKSIVIDATAITMSADINQATYVDAGTIMTKSADGRKMVPFTGAGRIEGILARPVPILINTTAGQEGGALYYRDVVFATASIVGFTQYAAALAAATSGLQNCGWE